MNVGGHAKRVDAALPDKHTRQLYDRLSWKEASVLAQLRTGMARLNGYLYRINVADTDQCVCVDKRERPWSTSYFDVKNGRRTGWNYYNVPTPTEETCPSSWEGNCRLMIRSGRRT
jgi:hypothetical protein